MQENTVFVIIDYWDSDDKVETDIRNKLYDNIISTVCHLPNLNLVVKSCYDKDKYKVNQRIDQYNWPCDSIECYHPSDLKNYLNQNNLTISNFVLAGMHWDRCIKFRDMGFQSLMTNFPESEIYVIEGCVLALNNYLKNSFWPNLSRYDYCERIHENIYRIIG